MDILLRIAVLSVAGTLAGRDIVLKPGVTVLERPMVIEAGEGAVRVVAAPGGSTLRAGAGFRGEALLLSLIH
ncbi:MAG: hypothetical protein ACK5ZJ_18715, partial [Acidobacteriota bacterium]